MPEKEATNRCVTAHTRKLSAPGIASSLDLELKIRDCRYNDRLEDLEIDPSREDGKDCKPGQCRAVSGWSVIRNRVGHNPEF
jgi:hypothetical protein